MAITVPSLLRARARGNTVHCLARLRDLGRTAATYADCHSGYLPPVRLEVDQHPTVNHYWTEQGYFVPYGWAELLYEHAVPNARVHARARYPVQRNYTNRYPDFATCRAARPPADHGGHYRAYLPGWCHGSQLLDEQGRLRADRTHRTPARLARVPGHLVLLGDAETESECGDGLPSLLEVDDRHDNCAGEFTPETSYIGLIPCVAQWSNNANAANQPASLLGTQFTPNRFAQRHLGGANYLCADLHAEHSTTLRHRLACDYNLDGIEDPLNPAMRAWSGCNP